MYLRKVWIRGLASPLPRMEMIRRGMMFGLPMKQEACVGVGGMSWLQRVHCNEGETRNTGADGDFQRMGGKRLGQTGKSGGDVKTTEAGAGQTHRGRQRTAAGRRFKR